jgi:hypothetical protein
MTPTSLEHAMTAATEQVTIGLSPTSVRRRATAIRRRRWVVGAAGTIVAAGVGVALTMTVASSGSSSLQPVAPTLHQCAPRPGSVPGHPPIGPYVYRVENVGEGQPNFTGVIRCDGLDQVDIYGVGDPGPVIGPMIDNPPPGITVVWHEVPFTLGQIERAAEQAIGGSYPGFEVVISGPANSQTGLEIQVRLSGHRTLQEAQAIVQRRITNGVRIVSVKRTRFVFSTPLLSSGSS